jgi:hypothetical protein
MLLRGQRKRGVYRRTAHGWLGIASESIAASAGDKRPARSTHFGDNEC